MSHPILEDVDFDGEKVFFVELANGEISEFRTRQEAEQFLDALRSENW